MSIPPLTMRLVELACHAPSVDNAQPWHWRVHDDRITLSIDRSRVLPHEDPSGRNVTISCGAALDHLCAAARAIGVRTAVTRLPEGPGSDVLATIELSPGTPSETAADDIANLRARCTDRRRLTTWPVPVSALDVLAAEAHDRGTRAVPVTDKRARFRLEALTQREYVESVLGSGPTPESLALVEGSDGVIALGGPEDGLEAWLRTGEGLSALWLRATRDGLAIVPMSLPCGVDVSRAPLAEEWGAPHLLIRVAWQAIGRSALPRTPRLALHEVLSEEPAVELTA